MFVVAYFCGICMFSIYVGALRNEYTIVFLQRSTAIHVRLLLLAFAAMAPL